MVAPPAVPCVNPEPPDIRTTIGMTDRIARFAALPVSVDTVKSTVSSLTP